MFLLIGGEVWLVGRFNGGRYFRMLQISVFTFISLELTTFTLQWHLLFFFIPACFTLQELHELTLSCHVAYVLTLSCHVAQSNRKLLHSKQYVLYCNKHIY